MKKKVCNRLIIINGQGSALQSPPKLYYVLLLNNRVLLD